MPAPSVELWPPSLQVNDELSIRTKADSMFLQKYFHTKMGDFGHLEGGAVMSEISKISDAHAQGVGKTGGIAAMHAAMGGCDSDEWSD